MTRALPLFSKEDEIMRIRLAALLLVGLANTNCSYLNKTRFISIDPEYAYVDGCTNIRLRGSNLGTTATAQIGGQDVVVPPSHRIRLDPIHTELLRRVAPTRSLTPQESTDAK